MLFARTISLSTSLLKTPAELVLALKTSDVSSKSLPSTAPAQKTSSAWSTKAQRLLASSGNRISLTSTRPPMMVHMRLTILFMLSMRYSAQLLLSSIGFLRRSWLLIFRIQSSSIKRDSSITFTRMTSVWTLFLRLLTSNTKHCYQLPTSNALSTTSTPLTTLVSSPLVTILGTRSHSQLTRSTLTNAASVLRSQ